MKKIYCLKKFRVAKLICTAFFLICTISNSKAQYAFIPDSSFRNWLNSNGYSGCMNGPLLDTTCSAVITATVVNCNNGTITNLTGIQYFDNLVDLHCSSNPLTFLPNLPSGLLYLEVTNAQLTSLSALPAGLITLNCGNNGITSLPQLPSH